MNHYHCRRLNLRRQYLWNKRSDLPQVWLPLQSLNYWS